MTIALTRPLAATLLAATLGLTACSGASESTPTGGAASPSQAVQAATADTDVAATQQVTAESAASAGVNLSEVGDPIATSTVPVHVEGDPKATMDVSLHSLTRNEKTVVGIFAFKVNSEQEADPQKLYAYLGQQSWRPYLIDHVNLTRHDVLSEVGAMAATDSVTSVAFGPGQTFFGYAAFAAPPEDVTSVTVSLVDGGPPAQDVPIQ